MSSLETYNNPEWVKKAAMKMKGQKVRIENIIKQMEQPVIEGKSIVWWFYKLEAVFAENMMKETFGADVYEKAQMYKEMKAVLAYINEDEKKWI